MVLFVGTLGLDGKISGLFPINENMSIEYLMDLGYGHYPIPSDVETGRKYDWCLFAFNTKERLERKFFKSKGCEPVSPWREMYNYLGKMMEELTYESMEGNAISESDSY